MENQEKFDNICINSQDSDVDVEIYSSSHITTKKVLSNMQHSNNQNHSKLNNLQQILVDESSNDSDEITFIRQISKPLLNTPNSKVDWKKRLSMHNRKKCTKFISMCFIATVFIAIVVFLLFLLIPNNALKFINRKIWNRLFHNNYNDNFINDNIVGCNDVSVEDVWVTSFPLLISEGAVRLVKINDDDILDAVIPFGTNVQNKIVCEIYFPGQDRCFGGLLALDGKNGKILWRYDGIQEMYSLVCLEDMNQDGWIDCLGAGRRGAFAAVSGRDGNEIWAFDKNKERNQFMNLYTAQFIDDIDNDGVRDIVDIHGGDPVAQPSEMNRLLAKLMVFSGRTGQIIRSLVVPDKHESYYSPQILNFGDGLKKVLYGTGGETFPGGLFAMNMNTLLFSDQRFSEKPVLVYKGTKKGVMTPPVLVDLNLDGRPDIVICPFADECLAIDGVTMKQIWKFDLIKMSETYVTPTAGYYNNDNVPDIFIQLFVGLGYPVYFYGETLILDGRNGKLLKNLTRSNNVVISSPLTLSIEGYGNDLFLYWLQLCHGHESDINEDPFQNLPQYILSRAHLCKIRFNTTTESLFLFHGKNLKNQSISYGQIYNSENYFHIEHKSVYNRTKQIEMFLLKNPEYRSIYNTFVHRLEITDLSKADDSYAENTNSYHDSILKDMEMLKNVDINDALVHGLIDFSKSDDHMNFNEKNEDLGNTSNDNVYKRFRYARNSKNRLYRSKRHNGPHDGEGLMRLISTGTLAPPILDINNKDYNQSMDVIFVTYWSEPKEIVLQTKMEIKCNLKWSNMEVQRFKNDSKFFYYDHDHYTRYGNLYCAKKYGNQVPLSNNEKKSTVFNSHFGQLTVYRKRLKCTCSSGLVRSDQRCSRILPFHLQSWPGYLGLGGTGYWNSSMFNLKLMKQIP